MAGCSLGLLVSKSRATHFEDALPDSYTQRVMSACTKKVLPEEKRTRGPLVHELVSDSSQNKVN